MSPRHLTTDSPRLLLLLASLTALGPLSVDMYLPALPAMMQAFGTDIPSMHITISAYLAGFSLFHLACGPLADRYGRKPVLLAGTGLFVLACIGCAQSGTVQELWLYRFLQGVGACVGPTLARTVARDLFGPHGAARALSLIAMLMALAPALAPSLGGVMLLVLPWPSVFLFLAAYGAISIAAIALFLPESLPQRQSLHPVSIARNYGSLLASPAFLSVTLAGALLYAGLMVYLACSSFVYIDMLGVPAEYLGAVFLPAVFGYMAGSALSARLSRRLASEQVMPLGAAIAVAATLLMWGAFSLFPGSVTAIMLPMALYAVGLGLVMPHAMAIALRPYTHMAGTASAMLGFLQMGMSSIASARIGEFLQDSPLPMFVGMAGLSLGTLLLALAVWRRARP